MKIIETDWKWKSGLSPRPATRYIVLHHAAASVCTAAQIDSWHKGNGWSGIGYHYFVRKDGSVWRGRPEQAMGAHASGHNGDTIGICAEGNFMTETMPQRQREAITELISDILTRYPSLKIKGHKDMGTTGCPGTNYPLAYFQNYDYKGGMTMTQYEELKTAIAELTKKNAAQDDIINKVGAELAARTEAINALGADVAALAVRADTVNDTEPDYRPTVQKLVDSGLLKGDESGNLRLSEDMLRMLTILDRAGVFA